MVPRLFVLCLCLLPLAATAAPALSLLPASDARYRYEGRFDAADPAAPVMIWSGSRIRLDFTGDGLAVDFGPGVGQCVFNVTVDNATEVVDVRAGAGLRFAWPRTLGPGRHRLEIFKRSEAAKGQVAFHGVELAAGAEAWASPTGYRLKLEFFGDSITAGACNEDGATDQWDDFRMHNYAMSWAHLTAEALGADDRAMAYSGMGVITGWETVKAGEIWDKVYPRPGSPRADLTAWQPEVAFVNLGENDTSFTEAKHQPFPAGFTAGYVALVKAIRAGYPHAQIVLLRGGMHGGAKNPDYRAAWEAAVHELEAGDPRIAHYVFAHWSPLHPRVSDDRAMADELTAWLKAQAFMAPY